MFFYASKILGFFLIPSNAIIMLGIVGALLLRTRFARTGFRLVAASLILLAIVGLSPIGNALIVPLEHRFRAWDEAGGAPHGIVVLGGAISPEISAARSTVDLNEAAERMTVAVDLARRFPDARVVFSGGVGTMTGKYTEAQAALRLFESLGLPRARIILEDRSRNTYENAVFSKEIAQPKAGERWLLVTSAYHMPRSIGTFRKAGFVVEPYPVDWRTRGPQDAMRAFDTVGDGLRRTDTAMREWVGLIAYWMAGQTSDLFPAPRSPAAGCDLASPPTTAGPTASSGGQGVRPRRALSGTGQLTTVAG
jgi:uncharacterized SAM-binding protein YcdF (DUF218 family)